MELSLSEPFRKVDLAELLHRHCLLTSLFTYFCIFIYCLARSDDIIEEHLTYLAIAGGFIYVFAKVFIVVESFISIRSLQIGAYDTVNWISLWPHV